MSAFIPERRMGGASTFAISLLLTTPSIIALFASSAIVHEAELPTSALWFVYEMSLYLGCVGVAIVIGLTISAAIGHRISRVFVWLMGISAAGGAFLLWYAAHIYRSPW
jgi:hypothetical protein